MDNSDYVGYKSTNIHRLLNLRMGHTITTLPCYEDTAAQTLDSLGGILVLYLDKDAPRYFAGLKSSLKEIVLLI